MNKRPAARQAEAGGQKALEQTRADNLSAKP